MLGRKQPFDSFEGEGAELSILERNEASGLGCGEQGTREDEVGEEGRGWATEGFTGHGEELGVYSHCNEKSLSVLCRKGLWADVNRKINLAAVDRMDEWDKYGGNGDLLVSLGLGW